MITLLASVPGAAPEGAEGGTKLLKDFEISLLFTLIAVPARGKGYPPLEIKLESTPGSSVAV
jgi:hypothetical protein